MSRSQYLELNERLADELFSDSQAGRPVYVGAEDGVLDRALEGLKPPEIGSLRFLCLTVRSTLYIDEAGVSPFRWHVDELARHRDRLSTPPTIGLLVLFAIAADQMASGDGMAAHNYYGRLLQLLDVPDDRHARVQSDYQHHAEELWSSLNDWLVAWEGSRGVPTAYPVGMRYVGLPMSQALVREHDRGQLMKVFRAEGLPPGFQMTPRDMEDVITEWVSRSPSPMSNSFRTLFGNPLARERMLSVACLELEAWDGSTFGDGELQHAAARSFGDLRLVATLRTFLGKSLEINLMVPLVDGEVSPLSITAGSEEVSLDVSMGAGGSGRLSNVDSLDLDSLLIDHVEGSIGAEERPVERRPRRVVPLRWHDLQSAYVEVERVERGDKIIVLALNGTKQKLVEFLNLAARPGFTLNDSFDGLPEGWMLVSDVQIMSAVEGVFHKDFLPLIPRAQTSLAFSGGLSLPGNLRKWSRLAPPELHAVAAGAEQIRVQIDEGSRMGHVVDSISYEGESAILDVASLELEDGEYFFTLFVNDAKAPSSTALLRLRSADTPVSEEAIDGSRLVYDSSGGPSWSVSAGPREGGLCVDGVVLDEELDSFETEWREVREFWNRPKPISVAPVIRKIRVGRQLGDDSCMHTGAHRFQLPEAGAGRPSTASIEGECETCGIVRRFPTTPWAAKKRHNKPIQRKIHVSQLASSLPAVKSVASDVAPVLLDAVSHVGSGSLNDMARIAGHAEASAVFTDALLRDLEAVGHIDVRRDEVSNVAEWGVNFSTLVPTQSGLYLCGRISPSMIHDLRQCAESMGGELVEDIDRHLVTVQLRGISPGDTRISSTLDRHGIVVLDENPALRLAKCLPAITTLTGTMPRRSLPASRRVERWDTPSARWVETDSLMSVGAYRIDNFSRTYCLRDELDISEGTIRIGSVQIVKHVASAWAGDPLVGYHARTESLLVPQGADLPGLYARAAVSASGLAPHSTSVARQYQGVSRELADVLFTKLST